MAVLIDLRGLTVELPTPAGWIRPVDDVSFALEWGESLGLVGESGSGKSMLALMVLAATSREILDFRLLTGNTKLAR
jgi:ABC-type glutathione transport system ATPase component